MTTGTEEEEEEEKEEDGRILMVIRRQAHVMSAHSDQGSSTSQGHQLNQIQNSIIKTMILVCGLFAVTWAPSHIYMLLVNFDKLAIGENSMYTVMLISYVYFGINPFIYAAKFDPIKRVLLGLIPCKKNTQYVPETGGNTWIRFGDRKYKAPSTKRLQIKTPLG